MNKNIFSAFFLFCVIHLTAFAGMTNDDVLRMYKEGIPEETIIMAIKSEKGSFNMDAQNIIHLNQQGLPMLIINAMISKEGGEVDNAEKRHHPESVILESEDGTMDLSYLVPQNRVKARGFGFGGVVTYAVLAGKYSTSRISDNRPSFIVAIPEGASAKSYVALARMEPRKNKSREVVIGGGYLSYSTGIIPERLRDIKLEELADQSKAPENFILYKVALVKELKAGEYALVLSTGQIGTFGFFGGITTSSWFDFGID